MPDLSVILPAVDEERALARLLPQLAAQTGVSIEIVVVDGGSTDQTVALATRAGARVLTAERGRGRQMNAGAAAATAPHLLFLHADSGLPDTGMLARALATLIAAGDRSAGHFPLRFERADARHPFAFCWLEAKTRTGRPHTIHGDQGLLLSRAFFDTLGPFEEALPFFEDEEMAARIAANGRWILLPDTLTTSARRFEAEGLRRRLLLLGVILGMYWADVRPFFARAQGVYREQSRAEHLQIWPFYQAWGAVLRDLGPRRALAAHLRLGRYLRQNLWQVFFTLDVITGGTRWLAFHDRRAARWTDNRVCDALAAGLLAAWYYGALMPYFWWTEGRG